VEEEDGIYDLLIRWRLHRARASINEVDIFYCRATEGKAVFGSVSHYKLKLHGLSIIILLFTTFSALSCMIIGFRDRASRQYKSPNFLNKIQI
jgi:hypothetical protein